MSPAMRAILERYLAAEDLRVLEQVTQGWRHNPFEYSAEMEAFQVREDWALGDPFAESEQRSLPENILDSLLRASEVLTSNRGELDRQEWAAPAQEATSTLTYRFERERLSIAERFEALLDQTDYRVSASTLGDGARLVAVELVYRTDLEYSRQKDHVQWLVELAEHLARGSSMRGERLR